LEENYLTNHVKDICCDLLSTLVLLHRVSLEAVKGLHLNLFLNRKTEVFSHCLMENPHFYLLPCCRN
jgi:hypothetical protein